MLNEQGIMHSAMMAVSRAGTRIWRQNVGMAVAGKAEWMKSGRVIRVEAGDCVVRKARPFHAGLCKGSSDLIGITPVVITPDMVGRTLGVFTALEVKKPGGCATDEQSNFLDQILKLGGFAGVARSDDDAIAIAKGPLG